MAEGGKSSNRKGANRNGAGARAGRGGARPGASERQPRPPRFLFRLAAGEGRALRLRLPYGRGGNARGHVSPLFQGGRPGGVRSFYYFSPEPDSVPGSIGRPRAPPPCVSCPGIPIPVASVHCWAQPSGRRGLGLQVIPGGHLPLPHPVDAASSSPPCLLLNRILCSSAYELKMKIIVINVFQKPVTEDGCENTRRIAAHVTRGVAHDVFEGKMKSCSRRRALKRVTKIKILYNGRLTINYAEKYIFE
ncbi:hypothetical protein CapIbe_012247 [Capra ibex]